MGFDIKRIKLFSFLIVAVSAVCIRAQLPPPPIPKAEAEIRDNSIKMRSYELERIKRDAAKPYSATTGKEREIKFAEIKKDFEEIQRLQDSIIKAYTHGRKINYERIGESAAKLRKDALRLDVNLFGTKPEEAGDQKGKDAGKSGSVKDLIIELDRTLSEFIASPIFNNTKVVDSKASKKAQIELEKIIDLSQTLSDAANRMK